MHATATPVTTLFALPELKDGERFYCGAVTPILIRENGKPKKVTFHLIIDESDNSKRLNNKFPGGRVESADYDEEMWNENFRSQLQRVGYNSVEVSIIQDYFKARKLNIFERTLVRELVTETGYIPMSWKFLTGEIQKENQTAGKENRDFFQLFFYVTELVQPAKNDPKKIASGNNIGLCSVTEIMPDFEFVPLDEQVKNGRLSMDQDKIFRQGNLVRSHHAAAKLVISQLMQIKEYCMVMYDFST